jgi:hypothetical protein
MVGGVERQYGECMGFVVLAVLGQLVATGAAAIGSRPVVRRIIRVELILLGLVELGLVEVPRGSSSCRPGMIRMTRWRPVSYLSSPSDTPW